MPSNHLILCRPLLLLLSIFPASGSFQMSQIFASGGQNIGVSASTSVLPMNTRTDLLQNGLVGSPCQPKDSQVFSNTTVQSINSLVLSFLHSPTLTPIHNHWKNNSYDYTDLCQQMMSLLFNMLSWFIRTFLTKSKHLLILSLHSPSSESTITSNFGNPRK